ncbi:hypothetical protein HMPREF9141_1185 [Prevotella multiformis DSM 16608]|uniref:Uncharacterized protein n=1 Tax=Prevotella multiformis DSM 16608 TaxID=888743 RepID=F0F6G3_9BACT|nr:hypothetical protein HMPREF9141_1185 [Prevotella multiformis DSM 16608]
MPDGMSGTSSCAGHRRTELRIKKSEKGGWGWKRQTENPAGGIYRSSSL